VSLGKYVQTPSGARKITPALRDEAAAWCARLARDRAQPAWSIRLTRADIAASAATQVAWRAYCEVKEWLAKDTAPRDLWAAAEALLREERDDPPPPEPPPESPPPRAKPAPPEPPPKPLKKTQGPQREKERSSMAKKQTRRSISVSKKTYDRARAFADDKGVSLSQLTEAALAHAIEHFYKNEVER